MKCCEEYQELISRLLDGDLSEREQDMLAAHTAVCPDCAAVFAAFSALSQELSDDLAEPPEALHETIMADVRREAIRQKNRRRPGRWRGILAAAACFALIVLAASQVPRFFRMGSTDPASMNTSVKEYVVEEAEEEAVLEMPAVITAETAEAEAEPSTREDAADANSAFYGDQSSFALPTSVALPEGERSERFAALLDAAEAGAPDGAPDQKITVSYSEAGAAHEVVLLIYGEGVYCAAEGDDGLLRRVDTDPDGLISLLLD